VESLFLWEASHDPVLVQKMEPEVAARRARFQKLVKQTVGGGVAMCALALACSLVGSLRGEHDAPLASAAADLAAMHAGSTPALTLEVTSHGKAKPAVTKAVRARTQSRR
jgi:hypothetical protein